MLRRKQTDWLPVLFAFSMTWSALAAEAEEKTAAPEWIEGIPFVSIPGGCFVMGSPEGESDRDEYESRHEVCVGPFALSQFEISNADFLRFKPEHQSNRNHDGPQQPVVSVTWHEAVAYADWLSTRNGRKIRLPTEAEWEYAARAGTTTSRHWGEQPGGGHAVCDGCGTEWDVKTPAPVTALTPNPFGLHQMLGNVWEWTCSAFDIGYTGGETRCEYRTEIDKRVRRGGGWADDKSRSRAAMRSKAVLDYRSLSVGIRLLMEPK